MTGIFHLRRVYGPDPIQICLSGQIADNDAPEYQITDKSGVPRRDNANGSKDEAAFQRKSLFSRSRKGDRVVPLAGVAARSWKMELTLERRHYRSGKADAWCTSAWKIDSSGRTFAEICETLREPRRFESRAVGSLRAAGLHP